MFFPTYSCQISMCLIHYAIVLNGLDISFAIICIFGNRACNFDHVKATQKARFGRLFGNKNFNLRIKACKIKNTMIEMCFCKHIYFLHLLSHVYNLYIYPLKLLTLFIKNSISLIEMTSFTKVVLYEQIFCQSLLYHV